jgi:hypothetical protein
MTRTRQKERGRKDEGSYFGLPHAVMESPNYRALSAHAVKLLIDIGGQYRGTNNGDLSATWRIMHPLGWRSRDTLTRALAELQHFGLIEMTRQGGLNHCNLFAITWRSIDECKGKLDVSPTGKPSSRWREPKPPMPKPERKTQRPTR